MRFVITTTQSVNTISAAMEQFISETPIDYVPRRHGSLSKIAAENGADGVVVWENTGPVLYYRDEKLFFHPSMAKCRIADYRKQKQEDLMIRACCLQPGDSFLDCTLGMGADSIVAAYFTGTGRVTGLESQTLIAQIIKWGMSMYAGNMPWLDKAIKHVEVINCDHRAYLKSQASGTYEIVYFDPMFINPILHSQPISPLRHLANHDQLDREVVQIACRVARKRVVLKSRAADGEIERLGFARLTGSKHNPIAYGVIEVG
ncbi:MAG: class I SAM-dependent methyltransferase [Syntrophomonadaceae bacterium]|nr:class I SAM-dependent methyltransferase [Syntrophomonadaceae bacterium]